MQLLRVSTDNIRAHFNEILDEDLRIKDNSKIALQNISMELKEASLTLNPNNNAINYSFVNGVEMTALVKTGDYTLPDDEDEILEDVENALNTSQDLRDSVSGYNIGIGWRVYLDGGEVSIEYVRSKLLDPYDTDYYDSINVDYNNGVYNRDSGGIPGSYDSYAFQYAHMVLGCGPCRAEINNYVPGEEIVLGLSKTNPATSDVSLSDIEYGIKTKTNGSSSIFSFIRNGVIKDSNPIINVNVGDCMSIGINGKFIDMDIYNSSGRNRMKRLSHKPDTLLYPIVFFLGDSSTSIKNFQTTIDEHQFDVIKPDFKYLHNYSATGVPVQELGPTDYNLLKFQKFDLPEFLGFEDKINDKKNPQLGPFSNKDDDNRYIFDSDVFFDSRPKSLLVMLDSIDLESYDTYNNKRMNILANIINDDDSSTVTYEATTPIFLNIKNSTSRNIRNIRARVLDENFETIRTSDKTIMTLLLDS